MQTQNFVQLELPLIPQKMETIKHMENAIQEMLQLTWNTVLIHMPLRTTKKLMSEHSTLIALHNGEALIRISSLPLYKIAQTKLPEIETSFQKAFGVRVRVRLEV